MVGKKRLANEQEDDIVSILEKRSGQEGSKNVGGLGTKLDK